MKKTIQFKRETVYELAFLATLKDHDLSDECFSEAMKNNVAIVRKKIYFAHVQLFKENEESPIPKGEWETLEILD